MVLQALSKDPDHVVIMTSENIATPLRTVKDKYSSDDEVGVAVQPPSGCGSATTECATTECMACLHWLL